MAKLFPSKQTFVDVTDTQSVLVSEVTILTSTSDHLELPNAVDAEVLQESSLTANPTFYLSVRGTSLAIDGATVGTKYVVVSNHLGGVNAYPGTAVLPDLPR